MKPNISEKILAAIKEREIKPIPRWAFLLKDSFFWGVSIITLLVGGCAFAVIIFSFKTNDWDLYARASGSLLGFFLATLPYFWIIIFSVFLFVAYYNFRHSKSGYRYNFLAVIGVSLAVSLLLGGALSATDFGQKLEKVCGERLLLYRQLNSNRETIWFQPEQGLLAGEIIDILEDGVFSLTDFDDKTWQILANNARKRGLLEIKQGSVVKIIGNQEDDNNFRAIEIRPWQGMPKSNCGAKKKDERKICPLRSK